MSSPGTYSHQFAIPSQPSIKTNSISIPATNRHHVNMPLSYSVNTGSISSSAMKPNCKNVFMRWNQNNAQSNKHLLTGLANAIPLSPLLKMAKVSHSMLTTSNTSFKKPSDMMTKSKFSMFSTSPSASLKKSTKVAAAKSKTGVHSATKQTSVSVNESSVAVKTSKFGARPQFSTTPSSSVESSSMAPKKFDVRSATNPTRVSLKEATAKTSKFGVDVATKPTSVSRPSSNATFITGIQKASSSFGTNRKFKISFCNCDSVTENANCLQIILPNIPNFSKFSFLINLTTIYFQLHDTDSIATAAFGQQSLSKHQLLPLPSSLRFPNEQFKSKLRIHFTM